jgi:hypothetical protein
MAGGCGVVDNQLFEPIKHFMATKLFGHTGGDLIDITHLAQS